MILAMIDQVLLSFSCFISDTRILFGIFLAPLFAVLLFNTVVFVMVTFVLIKHTRKKLAKDSSKKKEVTQGTIKAVISVFSVMLMFGLSWLFGAFSIADAAPIFQWPFVVFNTLQGFLLFLFFCVVGKDAREEWKNLLTCYRHKKKYGSMAPHSHASQVPKSTSTKNTELTSRYAQSRTLRISTGLELHHTGSVSDSKVPLYDFSSSAVDDNLQPNVEKDNSLVIANGSTMIKDSKVDLSSPVVQGKPRRKKASSQLPPQVQFKLKRPYYQVVIDQEESLPATSPTNFSQELTQMSDTNVFSNLTDDSTIALIDNNGIEYSVV